MLASYGENFQVKVQAKITSTNLPFFKGALKFLFIILVLLHFLCEFLKQKLIRNILCLSKIEC